MTFSPPPYPYERLDGIKRIASAHDGGAIDCSIGTPIDPPPTVVLEELARGAGARGYPPSAGTDDFRRSASGWLARRFGVNLGPDALAEAYRRMVFHVAAVNRNDHVKNFAFLRGRDTGWSLAPAFDVTHTYNPSSPWTSRHNLRVNGKVEAITLADLRLVGDRQDVPGHRRIVREVLAALENWPRYADEAELGGDVVDAIAGDLERFRPR